MAVKREQSELRREPAAGTVASGLSALQELDCHGNQLTSLDLSGRQLTRLDCSQNQLTSLDVSKQLSLEELSCGENQLIALDVTGTVSAANTVGRWKPAQCASECCLSAGFDNACRWLCAGVCSGGQLAECRV
mgnify:CR=1 FL=1